MNIYEARWKHAVRLATSIKNKCYENPSYHLMFDNEIVSVDQLRITDYAILLKSEDGFCTIEIFANDKNLDAGLYNTIEQTTEIFKNYFKIVKEIDWDLK